MTETKRGEIVRLVTLGLRPEAAARAAGVNTATMRSAKSRDPEFAEQLEVAEGRNEGALLATIVASSKKNWTAAAWILERRFAERWARPEVQVQLQLAASAQSPQDVAAAIMAAIGAVAAHHNPPGAVDVEDLQGVDGSRIPATPAEIAARTQREQDAERRRVLDARAASGALVLDPEPNPPFDGRGAPIPRDEVLRNIAIHALNNPPR